MKPPPGRHTETLREARAFVRPLEQATLWKFTQGGTDMATSKGVDGEAIRRDREAGMLQAELAAKYGVSQSTVSHHLNPKRAKLSTGNANGGSRTGNGARKAPVEDQVAALKRLADVEWQRLPVVERVRLLLSRGSA
jgi:hypothetical protein